MATKLEDYENAPGSVGTLKFEDDWCLLEVPKELHDQLCSQFEDCMHHKLKRFKRPHVSVMKDEAPSANQADWRSFGNGTQVAFRYHPYFHTENGCHAWVNVYSQRLCEIREHFGMATLKRDGVYLVNFHMTLGRLDKPVAKTLRPQYRLSPRTHIDVATLMQHI